MAITPVTSRCSSGCLQHGHVRCLGTCNPYRPEPSSQKFSVPVSNHGPWHCPHMVLTVIHKLSVYPSHLTGMETEAHQYDFASRMTDLRLEVRTNSTVCLQLCPTQVPNVPSPISATESPVVSSYTLGISQTTLSSLGPGFKFPLGNSAVV